LRAAGRTVVSLMRGEPDFRTPAHITAAATAALETGRTAYPDNRGEPAFRDAVAVKLARDNGLEYDPRTEILITTGATLGIQTALMAVLAEGDGVLLPESDLRRVSIPHSHGRRRRPAGARRDSSRTGSS
jgi:aspartate aminotransferase